MGGGGNRRTGSSASGRRGVGGRVSFELFGERSGEKGVIGEKSTFCYGDNLKKNIFSAF